MTRGVWKAKDNIPTIEQLIDCAHQGLSVNQAYRKLLLGSHSWIRRMLKDKPELKALFDANGKRSQCVTNLLKTGRTPNASCTKTVLTEGRGLPLTNKGL